MVEASTGRKMEFKTTATKMKRKKTLKKIRSKEVYDGFSARPFEYSSVNVDQQIPFNNLKSVFLNTTVSAGNFSYISYFLKKKQIVIGILCI